MLFNLHIFRTRLLAYNDIFNSVPFSCKLCPAGVHFHLSSFRLKLYELVEHKVKGDGNCQFRALSDQLYQTPDHHEFVREQIISQVFNL